MIVHVEDIYSLQEERNRYNREELSNLVFYKDGEEVVVPETELKAWEFIGLNNIDFILNREWPE